MKEINRRKFVKNVTGAALGAAVFPVSLAGKTKGELPKRTLGRTGLQVTLLSIGGFHAGAPNVSEDEAIQIIRIAIDEGVNFLDNAWSYHKGRSEELMGRALKDGFRQKVTLMTKIMARTLEDAKIQLETSLKRFDLDSVDLLQFHAIGGKDDDVDRIYYDGLIQWAEDQRSQGIIKYIGFTGHHDPRAHIEMIKRGYPWDTVQMPLNIGDYHREVSYQKDVLPLALENNIGVIGMKSNGMGRLGKSGIATPVEGLHYAMSLPVSTVVSGIDSLEILHENIGFAKGFIPMTSRQKEEIEGRSKGKSDIIEHYLK